MLLRVEWEQVEVETELEMEMEVGTGKQNRSREEREKGENKGKIGSKGLSPDTCLVGSSRHDRLLTMCETYLSGDAPSHTPAVWNSTLPCFLSQNSTLLPFPNSTLPSSWSSVHFHFWSYCRCETACVCTPRVG